MYIILAVLFWTTEGEINFAYALNLPNLHRPPLYLHGRLTL